MFQSGEWEGVHCKAACSWSELTLISGLIKEHKEREGKIRAKIKGTVSDRIRTCARERNSYRNHLGHSRLSP